MAELTIAQLTELLAANVDNADLLPIWDDNAAETKKITISNFRTAVGVTNWAESFSSATQATSQWIPSNAAANVNAAIVPKGTGAITAAIPDGTIVGGNARGSYAVDLQMVRNNANQVASGNRSSIIAGQNNRNECADAFLGAGNSCRITGTAEKAFLGAGTTNAIDSGANHVIVGGEGNAIAFASHSFIGGGQSNAVNNGYNTIAGGRSNSAVTQLYAFIGGGQSNTASGAHSVISGGQSNTVSGAHSNIAGGRGNTVSGSQYSTIAGGQNNTINQGSQSWQFIGGGSGNQVLNGYGVVCGGFANIAGSGGGFTHGQAFVGGGQSNRAQAEYATVVGGSNNTASNSRSFIGCGSSNTASGQWSSVIGGQSNTASQSHAVVGGGQTNTVSVTHGFIGGGQGNNVSGGAYNVVVGGSSNTCSGANQNNFVGGGTLNSVSGATQDAVNCGGRANGVSGSYAFNGAGRNNSVSGEGAANLGRYNTVSGSHANVLGGQENTAGGTYAACISSFHGTANLYGQHVHASGRFSANGDAQAHELVWRRVITGTATTELFLDGASIAAILPATNAVWHGIIDISSICTVQGVGTTVVGDVAATSYKVTIKRIGTNTSLVGSVQEIGTLNADVSMAAVAFLIGANDTNESLQIAFTPPPTAGADTVIRVVATFRGTQIQY